MFAECQDFDAVVLAQTGLMVEKQKTDAQVFTRENGAFIATFLIVWKDLSIRAVYMATTGVSPFNINLPPNFISMMAC